MQEAIAKAQGLIEEIAEELVMFDASDPDEASGLSASFTRISELLQETYPRASQGAATAAQRLQGQGPGSGSEGAKSLEELLSDLTSALQALLIQGRRENEISLPFEEAGEEGQESEGLAWGVDQEMLSAYVAQQVSMLSDLEDLILAYEKERTDEPLAEIKRLVHTAKGEAGVMGLESVAQACHDLEDYVQEYGQTLSPDILLEFKDWFETAVQACNKGGPLPEAAFLGQDDQAPEPVQPLPGDQTESEQAPEADHPTPNQESSAQDPAPLEEDPLLQPVPISDPEITAEFITEAQEHFDIADENLLTLESDPQNLDAVAAVFRAFHTIKGTCGFLGLTPHCELAHKAENLLDEVRREHMGFAGSVVDATFNALDMLKSMTVDLRDALEKGGIYTPEPNLRKVYDFVVAVRDSAPAAEDKTSKPVCASTEERPPAKEEPSGEAVVPEPSAPAAPDAKPAQGPETAKAAGAQSGTQIKQTMKIDADKIDLLLDTIGELVIVESIVTQDQSLNGNISSRLERNLAQLTKITRSLQDMGMSMRMIPIEATFRRMARLVRDLAKKSGKQVELEMQGKETELDKAMVEKLGDPLVHMVRNAMDHGIEPTPEDRTQAGKPAKAKIILQAYHEGGSIHIGISDDGRGLDREVIANKAVERGIIASGEGMSDEEIYALIFEPGFSTPAQITDVSGRGVGMDVVKSNIEALRGNIRITSQPGEGTTFTLVLPLTMAIIDGMLVRVGSERFILPLLSIIQSFQPTSDMVATVAGRGETLPFRGRLVPLFRLARLFSVSDAVDDPTRGIAVVVEDAGRLAAILVDELLGQNQTVIKSLGSAMGSIPGVAGASIMSDGQPGLIIDVNGVVRMATS
ncbi:MAG: Hpt domain-containing protein [Desulfovermiculus sp.]